MLIKFVLNESPKDPNKMYWSSIEALIFVQELSTLSYTPNPILES